MIHHQSVALLLMSLLALFGCSGSAKELPASLAELQVEILITDETERSDDTPAYSRQDISVVVRDAHGAEIERSDLVFEVNGVALEFRLGTGNYYDRHPYYQLADDSHLQVTADTLYTFTLVLPEGSRHELGSVRTPAVLALAQIDFPRRRPATGAVTIAWRELAETATVRLFRSDMWRDGDTLVLESGSADDPAALKRDIGPGRLHSRTDRWSIPEAFLAPHDGHELRALGVDILVTHNGHVATTFSRQSSLRAERRLTLRMTCTEIE